HPQEGEPGRAGDRGEVPLTPEPNRTATAHAVGERHAEAAPRRDPEWERVGVVGPVPDASTNQHAHRRASDMPQCDAEFAHVLATRDAIASRGDAITSRDWRTRVRAHVFLHRERAFYHGVARVEQ